MIFKLHLHISSISKFLVLSNQNDGMYFFEESQFVERIIDRFETFNHVTKIKPIRLQNKIMNYYVCLISLLESSRCDFLHFDL